MRKTRSTVIVCALVFVMLLTLGACGQPAAPAVEPTQAPAATAEPSQSSGEAVTLEYWSPENRDADLEAMRWVFSEFEKAHPNIKVNFTTTSWEDHFTRIQAASQADTMPDVFYSWAPSSGGLYQQGLISSLSDVMQSLGEDNFGGFKAECRAGDGTYYCIPFQGFLHVLYYRTDWFKEAGIEPPDNFEQFLEAARKLTTADHKGVQLYTRGFDSYYVMDLLTSNGVTPLDKDGNVTINTPGTVEVLQLLKTINDEKLTPDGWTSMNMDDAKLAFMNGSAAMLLNSTSFINAMSKDNPKALEYISIMPLPIGKGTMRGWAGNAHLAVSAKSKHPEEAKELIKFLMSPEIYKGYMSKTVLGFIPLYKPVAEDPTFLEMERIKPVAHMYKAGIKAGAEGGPMLGSEFGPNVVTFQAYNEMVYAQMAEKLYAGETPEDVTVWAEAEIKRIDTENK